MSIRTARAVGSPRRQVELRRRVHELGPWFHNLKLGGIQTAPDHFLGDYPSFIWEKIGHAVPDDLSGCTVLDIGCNAGFYALEMKRRGAAKVVGIDADARYLKQAAFAAEHCGLDIELRQKSVYDVADLGERFDLVLFMGLLYHLRHPLLALDLIHEHVARDLMLFQCLQRGSDEVSPLEEDYPFDEREIFKRDDFPKLFFVENRFAEDPTNWFIPNRAGVEAMLRSAGFDIEMQPKPEVYLCRRGERPQFVPRPPRSRL